MTGPGFHLLGTSRSAAWHLPAFSSSPDFAYPLTSFVHCLGHRCFLKASQMVSTTEHMHDLGRMMPDRFNDYKIERKWPKQSTH